MEPSKPRAESRSPKVVQMFRPFDPLGDDAEAHYDAVVRRVNRVRAHAARLRRELEKLESPFVEIASEASTKATPSEPLSSQSRRHRLALLVEVGAALKRSEAEERFAVGALEQMNQALDRWARETYDG